MNSKSGLTILLALIFVLFARPLYADANKDPLPRTAKAAALKKAAYTSSNQTWNIIQRDTAVSDLDPLVFSAPPRETPKQGAKRYGPIAEYLSQVIGKKIIYKHPGTWGVYRTEMLRGSYDLIFDGPHFNSYRAAKLNHNILVKIPKSHDFVVIVKKREARFANLKQMAGRTFCTHAPPNLGTLVLLSQFNNPARQPVIINTKGWTNIYKGVVSGRCTAGILPFLNLQKYDKRKIKIVFRARSLPNQAFSAGPRISPEDQAKIAAALVAPEAVGPTAKLRATYRVGKSFATASNQEYRGLAEFLKNEWGYY